MVSWNRSTSKPQEKCIGVVNLGWIWIGRSEWSGHKVSQSAPSPTAASKWSEADVTAVWKSVEPFQVMWSRSSKASLKSQSNSRADGVLAVTSVTTQDVFRGKT